MTLTYPYLTPVPELISKPEFKPEPEPKPKPKLRQRQGARSVSGVACRALQNAAVQGVAHMTMSSTETALDMDRKPAWR